VKYDTIKVEGAADLRVLGKCAGTDFETMKALNPALRRFQTPPDGRTDVHVPKGTAERTLTALSDVPPNRRVLYARHRVRRGDTLSGLARRYGVSVSAIQNANRMGRRTLIREGKVLVIPTVAARDYDDVHVADAGVRISGSGPVTYRVRRGDTLYGISRRYGTTPAAIAAANGIRVSKVLQIGERLTIWPGIRSAVTARSLAGGGSVDDSSGKIVHTVRRGDTLWRIATLYRTSVARLCTLNRISRHDKIYPGMKLAVQ
jgi:membrane-bound lytic murein transglycosylase D